MRKLLKVGIIFLVLIGLILGIKAFIRPSGSITLSGVFDPTTTRVYVDDKRILPADLGVRTFHYSGKSGSHDILVSGPGIKSIKTTDSLKPFQGSSLRVAVEAGPSINAIASKYLTLPPGGVVDVVEQFGNEWLGVGTHSPASSYTVKYVLHYDYAKGTWVVFDEKSVTKADSSLKDAPVSLRTFITDSAGE
jgi:hypothetical protein